MLSILSGQLKGMKLKVPTSGTRPTQVMLRRKMFDRFVDWQELSFFDLCAGSGSMGLEAISRGVKQAVFIEKASQAYQVLLKNIKLAKSRLAQADIESIKTSLSQYLEKNVDDFREAQIFYFDPPYANLELYKQLSDFIAADKTRCIAQWWIESDSNKGYDLDQICELFPLELIKAYHHGDKFIACMQGELP